MNERARHHGSRGQAVFESALAIPFFVIALLGVMWAYRTGLLSEQVQQSVRYGGLVSALADPYESYSLYTVYATIDQSPPSNARDCSGGAAGIVSQGHDHFWLPGSTPAQTTPVCGLAILFPSSGVNAPVILFSDYVSASASSQLAGQVGSLVFGNNTISASQNFFRSPDVGAILDCSRLGVAVKRSLEGDGDASTPITVPTPFPQTVTATNADVIPTSVTNACVTTNAASYGAPTSPY